MILEIIGLSGQLLDLSLEVWNGRNLEVERLNGSGELFVFVRTLSQVLSGLVQLSVDGFKSSLNVTQLSEFSVQLIHFVSGILQGFLTYIVLLLEILCVISFASDTDQLRLKGLRAFSAGIQLSFSLF